MEHYISLFKIAAESVLINKLRGILTALGVVFGVAAVITMLAIGSGAKKFILDQMRLIGTNNIVFEHKPPGSDKGTDDTEETTATTATNESKLEAWAPGMSISDVEAIRNSIPSVDLVSPEIIRKTQAMFQGKILDVRCVGITNAFFTLNNLGTSRGTFFTQEHIDARKPVCVIGKNVEIKLFSGRDPIGESIKCGNNYFTIIGVLDKRIATRETLSALGLRDLNSDIFIPLEVSLMRFGDRSRIQKEQLGRQGRRSRADTEMQQIDRLTVSVHDSKYLEFTADVIARMLKRRHQDQVDFSMEIPELLLQQEQKTQDIFNLVLAVIAGISLLVGGIGIMNIMLASVYERIREIGLRRAIGATSHDIVVQFLFEAVLVSVIGGLLGVMLGAAAAKVISTTAEIPTVISWWSIILSFGVAASIGLIFGIVPARKAAKLDPIEALRTD
jgi:putative ABC transport system permease protein